jgi:ribosomal protein S10
MLTLENTEGFDQEMLDRMNKEVSDLVKNTVDDLIQPIVLTQEDYDIFTEYHEKEVLKKYGGV